jgi:hypothetical protein
MTDHDVDGDDMKEDFDFEDPALADVVVDVRRAYRARPLTASLVVAELFEAEPTDHPPVSRSTSMRRRLAQLATATIAVVAASGGLAIAGALPAPVQDVVSGAADEVGVELPESEEPAPPEADATTTTVPEPEPTTVPDEDERVDEPGDAESGDATHPDNHGAEVSAVAQDKSLHGCEHGRAVSEVASGKVNDKPCPHADDTSDDTTPSTVGEAPDEQPAPSVQSNEVRRKGKPAHAGSGNGKGHAKRGR